MFPKIQKRIHFVTLLSIIFSIPSRKAFAQTIAATPSEANSNLNSTVTSSSDTGDDNDIDDIDGDDKETDCEYGGSLTDYLSCTKNKVSTPMLIGVGIGVTILIFILAFICVWFAKKKRRVIAEEDAKKYGIKFVTKTNTNTSKNMNMNMNVNHDEKNIDVENNLFSIVHPPSSEKDTNAPGKMHNGFEQSDDKKNKSRVSFMLNPPTIPIGQGGNPNGELTKMGAIQENHPSSIQEDTLKRNTMIRKGSRDEIYNRITHAPTSILQSGKTNRPITLTSAQGKQLQAQPHSRRPSSSSHGHTQTGLSGHTDPKSKDIPNPNQLNIPQSQYQPDSNSGSAASSRSGSPVPLTNPRELEITNLNPLSRQTLLYSHSHSHAQEQVHEHGQGRTSISHPAPIHQQGSTNRITMSSLPKPINRISTSNSPTPPPPFAMKPQPPPPARTGPTPPKASRPSVSHEANQGISPSPSDKESRAVTYTDNKPKTENTAPLRPAHSIRNGTFGPNTSQSRRTTLILPDTKQPNDTSMPAEQLRKESLIIPDVAKTISALPISSSSNTRRSIIPSLPDDIIPNRPFSQRLSKIRSQTDLPTSSPHNTKQMITDSKSQQILPKRSGSMPTRDTLIPSYYGGTHEYRPSSRLPSLPEIHSGITTDGKAGIKVKKGDEVKPGDLELPNLFDKTDVSGNLNVAKEDDEICTA
ncbi:uncharacterized protein IL334_000550 [Kwoniella shivajii]|uniref:Uncharacterized protein n=1 Tax=Kwoniella shivajii TaxID=564305 RepID=A0ABZ1CTN5_9TREE|nr:hypothetical protein IL334_000550 [Kwoniella shivajii]